TVMLLIALIATLAPSAVLGQLAMSPTAQSWAEAGNISGLPHNAILGKTKSVTAQFRVDSAATKPTQSHNIFAWAATGFVIGAVIGAVEESGHHTNCGSEVSCRAGIPYMAAAGGLAGGIIGAGIG